MAKKNREVIDGHDPRQFFGSILISKSTWICDANFFNMISTVKQPIGIVIKDNPIANLFWNKAGVSWIELEGSMFKNKVASEAEIAA